MRKLLKNLYFEKCGHRFVCFLAFTRCIIATTYILILHNLYTLYRCKVLVVPRCIHIFITYSNAVLINSKCNFCINQLSLLFFSNPMLLSFFIDPSSGVHVFLNLFFFFRFPRSDYHEIKN